MNSTITPPAAQTTDDLLDAIEDLHHRHDDGDPGGVFDFLEDLEQLLRVNGRPQFGTPWPNRALDTIVGANDDDITVDTTPAQGDNDHAIPSETDPQR